MTFEHVLGIVAVLAFVLVVASLISVSRVPRALKLLVYAALALRVVGSWFRYNVLFKSYGGIGDARGYFGRGLEYAERIRQLDFSPFFDPDVWVGGQWWGTSFVSVPSGLVLSTIGPSLLGGFLAFSLLSFLGLVGFAVAFRRAYPNIPVTRYARWIWLFPSLWFWPSSVGKDAIVLMGLGLAVAGFIGRKERINWTLLVIGTFLVFAVRPQVAAIAVLSFIVAHWLSPAKGWTFGKALQGVLILGVGLGGIWLSMQQIGVQGFDTEGVQSYLEEMSRRSAGGGSEIEAVGIGLKAVPFSFVNILGRPFLWEAQNPLMLLSALEILGCWAIVWYRRHNFVAALRAWRSQRFARLAVPFVLVYTIALGLAVANLGIIARQRIFVFPFLFLLLEAEPALKGKRGPVPRLERPVPPTERTQLLRTGLG
jgi:hypothetical protein